VRYFQSKEAELKEKLLEMHNVIPRSVAESRKSNTKSWQVGLFSSPVLSMLQYLSNRNKFWILQLRAE